MSKNTSVTISLEDDTYDVFQTAAEIISKAGVRISTSQLVQTFLNAETTRLNSRKIAQRFLKSIIRQVGEAAESIMETDEDSEDDALPEIPKLKKPTEISSDKEAVNSTDTEPKLRAPNQ